jgi:predicted ATPase
METYAGACHLHEIICQTYADFGYQLVDLPNVGVEGRNKFIKTILLNYEINKKGLF